MIEIKKLKQLIELMKDNELTELDLRDSDQQITLKRGGGEVVQPAPIAPPAAAPTPAPATGGGEAPPAEAESGLAKITSPMVGTFYAASSPDAESFVHVGSQVQEDTVVCIIEAMKVFNEIKAEVSGTVQKVLVGNGDAVEYGQPLFLVKPA